MLASAWLLAESARQAHVHDHVHAHAIDETLRTRLTDIRHYVPPPLPIDGDDIQRFGYAGKEVGQVLLASENRWLASGFVLDRAGLLQAIEKDRHRHG